MNHNILQVMIRGIASYRNGLPLPPCELNKVYILILDFAWDTFIQYL